MNSISMNCMLYICDLECLHICMKVSSIFVFLLFPLLFFSNVKLVATVPDGYTHDPMLTVMVMEHSLAACSHEDGRVEVPCILTFSSSLPTSITDYITFTNTRTGKRSV